jgi:preprotein translocase subunit SecF
MARRLFNLDFMGVRNYAFALSAVLMLGSVILLATRGLNLGLEFTGGTIVEMSFASPEDPEDIRLALEHEGYPNSIVQNAGSRTDFVIRTPPKAGHEVQTLGNEIGAVLAKRYEGSKVTRIEFVGPVVGGELRESGGLGLLLSFIVVGIYVMFRYTAKFSIGAIVALIHDPVITVGMFSAFQWTFDLPALVAVLAIIGYSINDTVVIFDRVRENFRLVRRATPYETINLSLNQTLDRTIGTHASTQLMVIALLLVGGEAVRGFSIAFFIGVVVGAYSSIYIAAAIVLLLGITREELLLPQKERDATP